MAEEKKTEETTETTEKTTASKKPVHKEKEQAMEFEGVVREALLGKFRVEIPMQNPEGKPHVLLAHIAGKLRKHVIKIVPGDRVKVEVSPYDLTKGRITYRLK